MYQQPLRQQQTWSGPQFAQAPKPPAVSAWPTAPVIPSVHPASAVAPVPHPASQQSFVPPVPPGVNPQQWQNGRWMFTAPGGGMGNAQPHGHPPPSLVGWNVPAGWGITPQYYHPPQTQKQPERSYWDTQLTDNGLGLENMHIKQPVAHTAPGESKDKAPHTPWAWVPRELDDDDDAPQASSAAQYHNPPQPQQPSLVGHSGTGYPAQGHAYFSVPGDQQHHHPQQQQRQQQPQQPSANEAGSRPTLPPATVFSAHIRQRSNPNPHQPTTPTHTQPSTAPGSQSSTAPVPSQPAHGTQSLQRSHFLPAPTPQRPGLPESFKSVKQLRPTFSPAIVRTPNHYRHDSQPTVPSPRVAPWEEGSAGLSASANRHLSGVAPMVPSPRVFPWNAHARASSPTPAPRNPQSSRVESSRMYDTSSVRGRQLVQRSYSIPEPPRPAPVLRQNSMPVVQSDPDAHHYPSRSSSTIPNLHQFAEEPGAVLSPLIGTVSESSESSASASTVVMSRSPPPLFIPPRYGPSPSPRRRRSRAAPSGSSSPSSSSDSSDSDDDHSPRRMYRSPSGSRSQRSTFSRHSGHSGNSGNSGRSSGNYGGAYPGAVPPALQPPHTPQGRSPASSTHTHRSSASSSNPLPTPPQERRDPGFSLPPPQQRKPAPGTYQRTVRYGYWNRRGDHLTNDQYVVYAPPDRANPRELGDYPLPTEGYRDHYGNLIKYDATRRELPESLPREGRPPSLPYERFVTYVYL